MDKEDFLKVYKRSDGKLNNQKIRHMPDCDLETLIRLTSCLLNDTTPLLRLKWIDAGCPDPFCETCGKPIVRLNDKGQFAKWCSIKCYSNSPTFKEKKAWKKVDQNAAIEKRKATNLKRHGVEFITQRDDVRKVNSERLRINNPWNDEAIQRHQDTLPIDYERLNDIDWILEQNEKRSTLEIAQELKCSPSLVQQTMRKHGHYAKCHFKSSQEREIEKFLSEKEVSFQSNKKIIFPNEIDIYIPDENLAIEVNGIYWHSEVSGQKDKFYHLLKNQKCKEKGIELLQFWDFEINEKWDLVQSLLLSKIGQSPTTIYARKCTVQYDIPLNERKAFLNENHRQGFIPSSHSAGLYYEGRLVSLMTFGKARFNKNYDWELLRFASLKHHNIVGAASKLFKKRPPGRIVSYSDNRFGNGSFYEKLGFNKVSDGVPNYHYTKDHVKLFSRNTFQKYKLKGLVGGLIGSFDPALSEWENMQMNGYDRIWDCGNSVWSFSQ